jgi:hypothetical protein
LGQGFTSVEADVFLVGGELLVGHSQAELQLERTLESLYLKPLSERAQRNGGSVFAADSPAQLLLHIDVKTTAVPTFQAIHDRLQKYPELFTPRTPQDSNSSPVRVVISGNRDYQQIVSAKPRWAGIDGRMKDLPSELAASDMPLVSDAWHTHFTWRGVGEMPADEKAKLRDLVGRAHHEGRQVRFWATPEKPELWMELQAADVDWINTDRLEQLREYLTSNPGQ